MLASRFSIPKNAMAHSALSFLLHSLPPPAPRPTRQVKCDRQFPCARCVRLRIACDDPSGALQKDAEGLISVSSLLPSLASAVAFDVCVARYRPKQVDRDKALTVLHVLAGLHHAQGHVSERLRAGITALATGLGQEVGPWMRPLSGEEWAAEQHRLAQAFPGVVGTLRADSNDNNDGMTTLAQQVVHPYALELFQEPFLTLLTVTCGGQERVLVNEGWAQSFESEAEVQAQLTNNLANEGWRPAEVFGMAVLPEDRAFVVPLLDQCLFGSPDPCSESSHVLRCQSPHARISFLALLRFRAVVLSEGYLSTALSLQPLPLPPIDLVQVTLPRQGLVTGSASWQHCLLWQEEASKEAREEENESEGGGSSGSGIGGRRRGSSTSSSSRQIGGLSIQEQVKEEDGDSYYNEDDEAGRESFRSDGLESERTSNAMSESGWDDGGRDTVSVSSSSTSTSTAFGEQQQQGMDPRALLPVPAMSAAAPAPSNNSGMGNTHTNGSSRGSSSSGNTSNGSSGHKKKASFSSFFSSFGRKD